MSATFRRAIRVSATDKTAVCEMEDNFHRFGVTIRHDGSLILRVETRATRYPWTACPMAGEALKAVEGMAITTDPTALYRLVDVRHQCTHQFETLGLAVTQAGRGVGERIYQAEVIVEDQGHRRERLWTNGALTLDWTVADGLISPPSPWAGRRPSSFSSSAVTLLPHDEAEALLILRRADFLAGGLSVDIERFATAADFRADGVCFTYQPERAAVAKRVPGSHRNFRFEDGGATPGL